MDNLIVTSSQAITSILKGKIGIMPTDTVYGLVALATDTSAVTRLYALKHRDKKPGTIIAASTKQLRSLGITQFDLDQVKQWWPNPLSAILPMPVREYLHQAVGSLPVRVVADPDVKNLLEQTGPLLTSSANLPGHPESRTIKQAYDYFGKTVDFYVDGGEIADRIPSTIIQLGSNGVEVLRQGSIYL